MLMNATTQIALGLIFAAVFLILFFALKFRNAGDDARTNGVALQAYGESHNFSLVAIVIIVVAVIIAILVK